LMNSYNWPVAKPEFPAAGLKIKCPNCKKSSVYQPHQLMYRAM
jgi:phage FluMu protein Com